MENNLSKKVSLFFYYLLVYYFYLFFYQIYSVPLRYNIADPYPLFPTISYDLLTSLCRRNIAENINNDTPFCPNENTPCEKIKISIMPFFQSANNGTNFNGDSTITYYDYTINTSIIPTSNAAAESINSTNQLANNPSGNAFPLVNTISMPLGAIPEPLSFFPLFYPWAVQDTPEAWIYDQYNHSSNSPPNIPSGKTYSNLSSKVIARFLGYNHLAEKENTANAPNTIVYNPLYFDYSNYNNDFFEILQYPPSRDPSRLFGYGYFDMDYKKYGLRAVIEMRPYDCLGFKIYTGVASLDISSINLLDTTSTSQGPTAAHMYGRYPDPWSDTANQYSSTQQNYNQPNIYQLTPYTFKILDNNQLENGTNKSLQKNNTSFIDQFKAIYMQNIQNNINNLGLLLNQDFTSYNTQGMEDTTAEIYYRTVFVYNDTPNCRNYPVYAMMPIVSFHITAPFSTRVCANKIFAKSLGNNGHWEYGINGGVVFDFFHSLALGCDFGVSFFNEGYYHNSPVMTKLLEEGIYTFTGNILRSPGNMYTISFNLQANEFLKHFSFNGEYRYVHHAKDSLCIESVSNPFQTMYLDDTHVESATPSNNVLLGVLYLNKSQGLPLPGVNDVYKNHMEDISQWSIHLMNIALYYSISDYINFGLLWEQPFSLYNTFNSSTVGISLNIIW